MAFSRKGFRRLVIGNRVFFWRLDWQDLYHQTEANSVAVRPEDAPHCLLRVSLGWHSYPRVTPGVVRAWIDTALALGWSGERATVELDGLNAEGAIGPGSLSRPQADAPCASVRSD